MLQETVVCNAEAPDEHDAWQRSIGRFAIELAAGVVSKIASAGGNRMGLVSAEPDAAQLANHPSPRVKVTSGELLILANDHNPMSEWRARAIAALVCAVLCLLFTHGALASSVTLSWSPTGDPGVAGYFVYDGTAVGTYISKLNVGNYATAIIGNLTAGTTYYIAISSYDFHGYESALSTPVRVVLPVSAPTSTATSSSTSTATSSSTSTATSTAAADTMPPVVTITSPPNGAVVQIASSITITTSASDKVGVNAIEFYVNGSLTCTATTSPYTCNWYVRRTRKRTYNLQAIASDAAGNTNSSSIVKVTTP